MSCSQPEYNCQRLSIDRQHDYFGIVAEATAAVAGIGVQV